MSQRRSAHRADFAGKFRATQAPDIAGFSARRRVLQDGEPWLAAAQRQGRSEFDRIPGARLVPGILQISGARLVPKILQEFAAICSLSADNFSIPRTESMEKPQERCSKLLDILSRSYGACSCVFFGTTARMWNIGETLAT